MEGDDRGWNGVRDGLRVAIITEFDRAPAWQVRCIAELIEVEGVEVVLRIISHSGVRIPGSRPVRVPGWDSLTSLQRRMSGPSDGAADQSLETLLSGIPLHPAHFAMRTDGCRIVETDAHNLLRAARPDIILDLAPGTPSGEILAIPPLGVWCFRHGTELAGGRGRPGAREILARERVTEARLIRRSAQGTESILHSGRFGVVPDSLAQTGARLLIGGTSWPARLCRGILAGSPALDGGERERGAPAGQTGTEGEPPAATPHLRLLSALFQNWMWGKFEDLFLHENWGVGVLSSPTARLVDEDAVRVDEPVRAERWIRSASRNRYFADPFALRWEGRLILLVEEFDHQKERGWIRALEVNGTKEAHDRGRVLPVPGHTSYPYLLRLGDEIYCIPETGSAREVALFRAREFPHDWEKVGVLVSGFAAVDATIFSFEGRWWLLCSDNGEVSSTHLHAWYAETLTGPWLPHALNPIKSDVASARPAGTPFVVDGVLYRPGQDCSGTYGAAVVIHRVLQLTPTEFVEEPVRRLRPDPNGPFPRGLHTLTSVGELTLVDGKRDVFVPHLFARRFSAIFGKSGRSGKVESAAPRPSTRHRKAEVGHD